jgi:DNA-binding PucR family transcriptional regulator
VAYRDVEMLSLAMENEELLRRMVEREIGPMYADPSAERNLAPIRETVLAFLTNRLNVEATADQLFVHKNTVRYRLARAEEVLGRPLSQRPAQLELSLRYLAWFGPPESADGP